jgi:hypothetical protein
MRRAVRAFGAASTGCVAASLLLVAAMQAAAGRWSWHNTLDTGAALVAVSLVALFVCVAGLLPFARRVPAVPVAAAALLVAGVSAATAAAFIAWFLAAEDHSPVTAADWIAALVGPSAPPAIAGAIFGAVWSRARETSASAA